MSLITDVLSSFVLGLLTPLTAVCVLPLYPGFLAFLANKSTTFFRPKDPMDLGAIKNFQFLRKESSRSQRNYDSSAKKRYAMFGLLITLGVIIFMLLLGLIFTTILQKSLTNVIGIVSPIAFGILGIVSIFLIFDFDFGRFLPKIKTKQAENPILNALLYGFFFGAIVVPCNPGFISAFLARALLFGDFVGSMLNFLAFGFGLGFPLLLFSLVSVKWSQKIINYLTLRKRKINFLAGIIMLGVAIYYLVFVFNVFGVKSLIGL